MVHSMETGHSIEALLERGLASVVGPHTPPRLAAAMRLAVLGGGKRIRPRLALAVAKACGDTDPVAARATAVAVELLHCASLVHDDLPCFDDADFRRGRPTVHRVFGEPLAVLTGDGLIVAAFEVVARGCSGSPAALGALVQSMARATGSSRGLVAGQAWESEPHADLREYHRAKTGALFEAAIVGGAIAGGGRPRQWRQISSALGDAYQLADDLLDVQGHSASLGKPVGRDAELGRPSAVREMGIARARARLDHLTRDLPRLVPECPGRAHIVSLLELLATQLSVALPDPGAVSTPTELPEAMPVVA